MLILTSTTLILAIVTVYFINTASIKLYRTTRIIKNVGSDNHVKIDRIDEIPIPKEDDASNKHLIDTILEQGHLLPLPLAVSRKHSFPNYFIAIRLKSMDLKRMVEEFQEHYINGKFSNTRTSSNKMHLTYFVIKLDSEDNDVQRAIELFMSCDLNKLMTVKTDLLLGDLTFFGNQVIKIEVIKDDIYKKLDDIGNILHDMFIEHGFIKKESHWKWEPHATIAKISADRKNFKRLKYSKDMLEGKETTFSSFPVRLTTIDLLQMNDVDEDGYYKTIASKNFLYTV
jgi:hypothetical protein